MKKIELTTLAALNIISFRNQLTAEQNQELGLKVRWTLDKAVKKISPDVLAFEEFRDSEVKRLQEIYMTDEKSEVVMEPTVDEDGNQIKDDNGNVITEESRKVREEYQEQYSADIEELNQKLQEILSETNTYEISTIDMDAFVESLPDDTKLDYDVLRMLDAILGEADE